MSNTINIYMPPPMRRKAETVARLYRVKRRAGKVNISATIETAFDAAIAAKQVEREAAKEAQQ